MGQTVSPELVSPARLAASRRGRRRCPAPRLPRGRSAIIAGPGECGYRSIIASGVRRLHAPRSGAHRRERVDPRRRYSRSRRFAPTRSMMSLGRYACALGMFSAAAMTPTTWIGRSRRAIARMAPKTAAAPGHVVLHLEHATGRLQREAAGVEGDALADQREGARSSFAGVAPCSSTIMRGRSECCPGPRRGWRPDRAARVSGTAMTRQRRPTDRAMRRHSRASDSGVDRSAARSRGREAWIWLSATWTARRLTSRGRCRDQGFDLADVDDAQRAGSGFRFFPDRPVLIAIEFVGAEHGAFSSAADAAAFGVRASGRCGTPGRRRVRRWPDGFPTDTAVPACCAGVGVDRLRPRPGRAGCSGRYRHPGGRRSRVGSPAGPKSPRLASASESRPPFGGRSRRVPGAAAGAFHRSGVIGMITRYRP